MNQPISPEALLHWRLSLIRPLFFFSSVEIVGDAWLKGIQHVGWGWFPAEDCSAWFDDLNMKAGPDWALQEARITKSEYQLIVPFHEAFRMVCDEKENDGKKLLNTSSLSRLINEARMVCGKLPHTIKGGKEKELVRLLTKVAGRFWITN
ncbi:MAG: hypothetical protein IM638_14545 [Bacteroidetes bacterium]|nr:hypothetical protein [Bacteroidota bacterium]